ncbi:Ubiquitin-conjugating enzyme, E2 [Corchorus capsularis]|uniref:Ubiquitin-conjugating enzyme, E2 n=1 Tax=Corchorus capsularis TaxID=210143 RepID=A0A1R3GTK2_COCAP|nr:Ubiquitin-conjugating enzyme, E2 [Corchorus capsularis]
MALDNEKPQTLSTFNTSNVSSTQAFPSSTNTNQNNSTSFSIASSAKPPDSIPTIPVTDLPIENMSYKNKLLAQTRHLYYNSWLDNLQVESDFDCNEDVSIGDQSIPTLILSPDEKQRIFKPWRNTLIIKLIGHPLSFNRSATNLSKSVANIPKSSPPVSPLSPSLATNLLVNSLIPTTENNNTDLELIRDCPIIPQLAQEIRPNIESTHSPLLQTHLAPTSDDPTNQTQSPTSSSLSELGNSPKPLVSSLSTTSSMVSPDTTIHLSSTSQLISPRTSPTTLQDQPLTPIMPSSTRIIMSSEGNPTINQTTTHSNPIPSLSLCNSSTTTESEHEPPSSEQQFQPTSNTRDEPTSTSPSKTSDNTSEDKHHNSTITTTRATDESRATESASDDPPPGFEQPFYFTASKSATNQSTKPTSSRKPKSTTSYVSKSSTTSLPRHRPSQFYSRKSNAHSKPGGISVPIKPLPTPYLCKPNDRSPGRFKRFSGGLWLLWDPAQLTVHSNITAPRYISAHVRPPAPDPPTELIAVYQNPHPQAHQQAIRHGLKLAASLQITHLIVESDSLSSIQMFNRRRPLHPLLELLHHECTEVAAGFTSLSYLFVYRECNQLLVSSAAAAHMEATKEIEEKVDEVEEKFSGFKKFDILPITTVFHDHHFFPYLYPINEIFRRKSVEKIMKQELKTLEQSLPNWIFVRGYDCKGRLENTPYRYGLFFFDILIPYDYPSKPPQLFYHSWGHSLNNPKLGQDGKVGVPFLQVPNYRFNILEILTFIQRSVLNYQVECVPSTYFFEEEKIFGGTREEKSSSDFQADLRNHALHNGETPSEDFGDLVAAYFRKWSNRILLCCKEEMQKHNSVMDLQLFLNLFKAFEANGSYCRHHYDHKIKSLIMNMDKDTEPIDETFLEKFTTILFNLGEPPAYIQEMMKMMKAMEERDKASDEMANERFTVMEERIVQLSKIVNGGNGKALELPATADGEDMSVTHNGRFIDLVNQTPTKNTVTSATEPTYVTKEQLQRVLEQKNKTLSFSEFDLKLSYAASIAAKHYPKDYTSPKFKLFDRKTGDAREHVMKFVETLGVPGLDDDLKLKEFSKSLTEKAYTWYVNLVPGSIESWNQMCRQFGEKFFPTQEKVTLINLGRECQKSGEDVMDYIQRFRERVLDVHDAHNEKELVKVCIHGMFNEYRIHLENLPLDTFATLVDATRRTNSTIQRQKERYNRKNVHAVQFRQRDERSGGNMPPKRSKKDFQGEDDAPPFPISVERVRALLREWIRDGQINLPYTTRLPTAQEKADAKYCDYHRTVNHPFVECRNMRRLIHRRVQKGEIVINDTGVHNNPLLDHGGQANAVIHSLLDEPEDHHSEDTSVATVMTSTIAASLLKTPNVRRFFDLLGFCEETRKEAAEELVQIANKYHAEGIDRGSLRHPMTINSFDNRGTRNLGCVLVNFKIGNIQEQTRFHVIDADVAYHVLLGRKWLNSHYLVGSSLHQCVKGYWNGKEIFIPATKAPFEKSEVRYAETLFFDEVAEKGERVLSLPMGIPLPPLQEYGERSENNMKYNRKRTRRGGKRRRGNTSEGYRVPEKGVTSHTKSNKDLVYYL